MTTPAPTPHSGKTEDGDGLVHGLTVAEVKALEINALRARDGAYCPYSLFRVGCALLIDEDPTSSKTETKHGPSSTSAASPLIITGANVENASYPVGTCAERVAMGTAVVKGYRREHFKALGVATDMDDYCSPCGMCRQFLREFLNLETPVLMFNKDGAYKVLTMGELLPMSFGPDALPSRESLKGLGKGE